MLFVQVALSVDGKVYSDTRYIPRQHNKFLLQMIKEVFEQADIDKKSIDFIAYGVGPGSFVGVRLAASVCQAFAVSLDIPIIGFSSMFAIAKSTVNNAEKVAVIIDAKMGDFYLGLYNTNISEIISENVYKLDEYSKSLYNGYILVGEAIKQINLKPEIQEFKLDVNSLADFVYKKISF